MIVADTSAMVALIDTTDDFHESVRALFTSDLKAAFRFADDFDVGCLWINEASRFRVDNYPFGGVKSSGVGREGIRWAIEEMSQLKFIGIKP